MGAVDSTIAQSDPIRLSTKEPPIASATARLGSTLHPESAIAHAWSAVSPDGGRSSQEARNPKTKLRGSFSEGGVGGPAHKTPLGIQPSAPSASPLQPEHWTKIRPSRTCRTWTRTPKRSKTAKLLPPGATSVNGTAAVQAGAGNSTDWSSISGPDATGAAPARSVCGANSGAEHATIRKRGVINFTPLR